MTDFFAELEEDIREERLFLLWRKYGNFIIGLAIAIVLATAGYTLWQYVQKQNRLKSAAAFTHALSLITQGNEGEAAKELQILCDAGGGYGKLAQFYQATLLADSKAVYPKIIQANAKESSLGNLAKVLLAMRSLDDPATLAALEPLTAPQNAWNPLALELMASINLKAGKSDVAAKQFVQIIDNHFATMNAQMRARMMMAKLGAQTLNSKKP